MDGRAFLDRLRSLPVKGPDFGDKVCLITGAASGIGQATVAKMNDAGALVIATDITFDKTMDDEDMGLREELSYLEMDVTSSRDCRNTVKGVVDFHGRLDFVFNCAGVNPTAGALEDTTDEYWDKLVDTNLRGTFNVTRVAIPYLKPGGSIVNVSSILGTTAAAYNAVYCATKFGVVGFTKAMALELGPKGIRVNAVAPGYINTPTNASVVIGPQAVREQEAKIAMRRFGTADEVADVVLFLFSDEARYMNGSIVEVNGGCT